MGRGYFRARSDVPPGFNGLHLVLSECPGENILCWVLEEPGVFNDARLFTGYKRFLHHKHAIDT